MQKSSSFPLQQSQTDRFQIISSINFSILKIKQNNLFRIIHESLFKNSHFQHHQA